MSDRSPQRRRRLTPPQLLLILCGLGVVAGFLVRRFGGEDSPAVEALLGLLVLALLAAALVITLVWWRRLDEAAREAHKWAWYWGATVGIVAATPLLVMPEALGVIDIAAGIGLTEPAELVSMGVVAVLLLQTAGYGIAWAVWWLRRR